MSVTFTVVSESLASARGPGADIKSLRHSLEKGSDEDRIRAMKEVLTRTILGENLEGILMSIIRYALPSKSKALKKLLHSYWEVVPKHDPSGKLRHEMILVVNNLRNDLNHPNEFVRGSTLRMLSKIQQIELVEPLGPLIRQSLEHRHAYVRKNAIFCILGVTENYTTRNVFPDAPQLLSEFLVNENDATCRHNAFVTLARLDREPAYAYFQANYVEIGASGNERLQRAFIAFAAQDALDTPSLAESYISVLVTWLGQTSNTAVKYEAAAALARLATDATVLTAVGAAFIDIAMHDSDLSVKTTALKRLAALSGATDLSDPTFSAATTGAGAVTDGSVGSDVGSGAASSNADALAPLVMDVLLVLPTQDITVRRTALQLALRLVSNRTVDQVLRLLKQELANSIGRNYVAVEEYRHAIVASIDAIALRFRHTANDIIALLLEFLGELSPASAQDVLAIVKQLAATQGGAVISQLTAAMPTIGSARVYLSALWILGEYATTTEQISSAWDTLREAIGTVPFDLPEAESESSSTSGGTTKPRVLADGTYATESALEANAAAAAAAERDNSHFLRKALLEGNSFLAGAMAAALTKLAVRFRTHEAGDSDTAHRMTAEAALVLASYLRVCGSRISEDAFDRIYSCINVLLSGTPEVEKAFLAQSREAFAELQEYQQSRRDRASAARTEQTAVSLETPVKFRLFDKLANSSGGSKSGLAKKTSSNRRSGVSNSNLSQLKQVQQLTGFSDPVYAEALISIDQAEVVLDVMVFNQTRATLKNLNVQFYATGDLKVGIPPPPANVAPMSFYTAKVSVRVSSVDAAMIFGDISYDGKESLVVTLLNDIRINVIDYLHPAPCSDEEFRQQWGKFEWENKVPLHQEAPNGDLRPFVQKFLAATRMYSLSEDNGVTNPSFYSANFRAKSAFGELILVNLSFEVKDNELFGFVRVRAQKKGAAVSIGECVEQFKHKRRA